MNKTRLFTIPLVLALALAACNLSTGSPQSGDMATAAALTVQAVLTANAQATQEPLATPQIQATACKDSATNTAWLRDQAFFDVKLVKTPLDPKSKFTITWTFRNEGECIWDSSYQMYFESGTPMADLPGYPLMPAGQTVNPGGSATVNIEMTAPEKSGDYESSWRLQSGRGDILMNFGLPVKVGSAASSSLAAPGELRYSYDCTTGSVNITLDWKDRSSDEEGFHIYRDGTKLTDVPANTTSYADVAPASGKYEYTVSAYNGSGEAPSKVLAITDNCK